jgi:hypothetical protein
MKTFYTTTCPDCGQIDGSVLKTKSYNPARDLQEWTNEGRLVKERTLKKGEKFSWCRCSIIDKENEEQ